MFALSLIHISVRNIFWSKFLVIAGLSFVTQVLFFALYLAAGFYFGFQSPVPPDVILSLIHI